MRKKRILLPLIIFFIIVNSACLFLRNWLNAKGINYEVLLGANCILFFVTMVSTFLHFRTMNSPNPYAFVRSVTAATFIKLFVIAGTVVIYLLLAKENRSVNAIFAGMGLYIIYTAIEVRGAHRLNKEKDGNS